MAFEELLNDTKHGIAKTIRASQVEMTRLVENVLTTDYDPSKPLIAFIEAGTGTGKSFAYLLPAILSGKRIVISTAKKALQRQLIEKDIPFLVSKLNRPVSYALLKGKNNYACALHVEEMKENPNISNTDFQVFSEWFNNSQSGDLSEKTHPRYLEMVSHVTECVRKTCSFKDKCGYVAARNAAVDAQILVVNHALLATDLAVGGGKILGAYGALVIDEGHQAGKYFRDAFTLRLHHKHPEQLKRIFHNTEFECDAVLGPIYAALFQALPARSGALSVSGALESIMQDLLGQLEGVRAQLKKRGLLKEDEGEAEAITDDILVRALAKMRSGAALIDKSCKALTICLGQHAQYDEDGNVVGGDATDYLCFAEQRGKELPEVVVTPVEVGPLVGPAIRGIGRVIVTSATLSTPVGMDYIARDFGLRSQQIGIQKVLPSPFDYKNRAVCYIPDATPDPAQKDDGYYLQMAEHIHGLLEASQGGALVLCASYDDMNRLYGAVREQYAPLPYAIGYQSGAPEPLLEWFIHTKKAVLFAVKTFWEGIDVPGLGLRLVIIPRLPFPNYGDPVLQARKRKIADRLIENGMDESRASMQTWSEFDFQEAMMDLKQGVGRLIRSETDRGVVAILDRRAYGKTKAYSPKIRNLLPMPVTDSHAVVMEYLGLLGQKALGQ